MCDSSMGLCILPSQLEFSQRSEKDRGGCGCRKGPLQEVDFCTLSLPGQWEYELRMPPGGCFNAAVGLARNYGAQRLRIRSMAEAPYVLNLFFGQV